MEEPIQEIIDRIFLKYLSRPIGRACVRARTITCNLGMADLEIESRLRACACKLDVSIEICVKFWALYLKRYSIDPCSQEAIRSITPGALIGGFKRTQGASGFALFRKRVCVSDLEKLSDKIVKSSQHYHRVYAEWPEDLNKYLVMAGDPGIHPWWCAFHFPMIWWLGKEIVDEKRYAVLCHGCLSRSLSETYNSSMSPFDTGFWVNYYRRHYGLGI